MKNSSQDEVYCTILGTYTVCYKNDGLFMISQNLKKQQLLSLSYETFVKNFMKKTISFFNTNFQNSFQNIVFCKVLQCETYY